MIICAGCGHANGDPDAFCGSCGGFLEWEGEVVGPPAATTGARPVPAQRETFAPSLRVAATPPQADLARAPEPERERPSPVRPAPVDLGPAPLFCGACGAGNADGRSFCRRCGCGLDDALATPPRSWWRRLWRWLRRDRTYAAGERPAGWARPSGGGEGERTKRRWRPRMPARLSLGRVALPLAVLSLAGFGLSPLRSAVTEKGFGLYHDARQVVAPRYVPVSASGAGATSSERGHEPAAAIDQNTLTWWAEGADGRGRAQRLRVRFDRPVDLDRVTVHNGAADESFPFQPRVRGLRITLRGPDGIVSQRRLELADSRDQQVLEISGTGVTRVTLRVLSTYAGQRGSAASLAEVGFLSSP